MYHSTTAQFLPVDQTHGISGTLSLRFQPWYLHTQVVEHGHQH